MNGFNEIMERIVRPIEIKDTNVYLLTRKQFELLPDGTELINRLNNETVVKGSDIIDTDTRGPKGRRYMAFGIQEIKIPIGFKVDKTKLNTFDINAKD
ncbi:MAG: hypothetical protein ACKOW9_00225 [Candidatus Paceibacterota bacterium]